MVTSLKDRRYVRWSAVMAGLLLLVGTLTLRSCIPHTGVPQLLAYVVTPATYHDVSRHLDKFIEHQHGESIG